MKYKLLGKSGLRVSELCLGTMTFGEEWGWGSNKKDAESIYRKYVEQGGNFIDTANYYTKGTSETYLGEFIKNERDKIVLATKYTLNTDPKDPNAGGNHRKNLVQAVNHSLKRLNIDYIDLLWVHAWDFTTSVDEVLRGLNDVIKQGKVLYIGISDTPAWVVARGNTLAEIMGWSAFTTLQLEYSLLERTIEREYFSFAKEFNLPICSWSPLAMGVLTGKYLQSIEKGARGEKEPVFLEKYMNPKSTKIVETVVKIARESGHTPSQIAIRWQMQKRPLIIPILGAKTLDQLNDNLAAAQFELTDQQMIELDLVSEIDIGFPYDFLKSERIKGIIFGENYPTLDPLVR